MAAAGLNDDARRVRRVVLNVGLGESDRQATFCYIKLQIRSSSFLRNPHSKKHQSPAGNRRKSTLAQNRGVAQFGQHFTNDGRAPRANASFNCAERMALSPTPSSASARNNIGSRVRRRCREDPASVVTDCTLHSAQQILHQHGHVLRAVGGVQLGAETLGALFRQTGSTATAAPRRCRRPSGAPKSRPPVRPRQSGTCGWRWWRTAAARLRAAPRGPDRARPAASAAAAAYRPAMTVHPVVSQRPG